MAQNSAAQLLALIVSFADRFLVVGILLRAWGTSLYSDWAILMSVAGLLSLTELGLNIYYGNAMHKAWAAGDARGFQRIIATALTVSASLGAIAALVATILATAPDIFRTLSIRALSETDAAAVFLLLAFANACRIARTSISQIFRGRNEFAAGILADLAAPMTLCLAAVCGAWLGASPFQLAFLTLSVEIVVGWVGTICFLKARHPDLRFLPALPTAMELRDMTNQALWLAILQGGPVVWLQAPIIVIGQFGLFGTPLVGFVLMRTLANFVRTICGMLSLASGVELAALHHAGKHMMVMRQLRKTGYALSFLSVSLASAVITFGPSFVRFWSGLDALFDRPTALALLAGAVLAAPSMAIGSYLVYSGSAKPNALALSFQLATGLLFCAALAPALGAVGTGIGLALGEGIGQTAILPMLAAGSLHDLDYFRYLRRCLAVIAFSAGWCASLSSAVTFLFDVTAGSGFVCASAVWIVLAPFPLAAAAFRSHRAKSSGPVAAGPVAAH